jgi:hypothetical protein
MLKRKCWKVDVYNRVAPRPRDQSTSVVASDLVALSNLSDHSNILIQRLESAHLESSTIN